MHKHLILNILTFYRFYFYINTPKTKEAPPHFKKIYGLSAFCLNTVVFNSIFSNKKIPLCIQKLFRFFDNTLKHHLITDKKTTKIQTLHSKHGTRHIFVLVEQTNPPCHSLPQPVRIERMLTAHKIKTSSLFIATGMKTQLAPELNTREIKMSKTNFWSILRLYLCSHATSASLI